MHLSSFHHPQDGDTVNYFVDKTFCPKSASFSETVWWCSNVTGGTHTPIDWPIGGSLDFLAYSLSSEPDATGHGKNVIAEWDNVDASSRLTLTIPAENSQNDILFASAYGLKPTSGSVPMTFNHAQAWLEFVLTGGVDDKNPSGIVTLKRIGLENVYDAGVLTVDNNRGNAFALWDFTDEEPKTIEVDNFSSVTTLNGTCQFMDMLIPQQRKTSFVLYYTLGSDSKIYKYRFPTYHFSHWSDGSTDATSIHVTGPGYSGGFTANSAVFAPNALSFTATDAASTIGLTNAGSNAPSLEISTDGFTWSGWDYSH